MFLLAACTERLLAITIQRFITILMNALPQDLDSAIANKKLEEDFSDE